MKKAFPNKTSSYFPKQGPSNVYVDKFDVLESLIDDNEIAEESNFGIRAEGSLMSNGSRRSMRSSTSKSLAERTSEAQKERVAKNQLARQEVSS